MKLHRSLSLLLCLALLLGAVMKGMACVANRKTLDDGICVLMLSVIGITLFTLIFECRARYLYLYSPFYVLLGISGIWYIIESVISRFGAKK